MEFKDYISQDFSELQFFKSLYDQEHQRKDEYEKLVGYPTTILVVLCASSWFFLNEFLNKDISTFLWDDRLFIASCIVFFISAIVTIVFLSLLYFGYPMKYQYLAFTDDIMEYKRELIQYYTSFDQIGVKDGIISEKWGMMDFYAYLISSYAETTANNARINDNRRIYYYRAKLCILVNVILFFLIAAQGALKM